MHNKEKKYQRSHEPVFWGLFGAGGSLTALITPAMLLITGIMIPLGIIKGSNFNYESLYHFASSWIGAIIIMVLVCLPLWHCLHRIFHGLHDLGVKRGRDWQQVLCYGFAFMVSVFVATILLQLVMA